VALTAGNFGAVLRSLGAGSGLVLPVADLALGAEKALVGRSPVARAVFEGLIATASLFVDRPELLAETQWAWLGGVWYFEMRNLWPIAEAGDFQTVQVKVNGASPFPAGWSTRLKAYQAWTLQTGPLVTLGISGSMDAATSKRLQQWVGVAMDGDVGRLTYAALQKWLGLTADGTLSANDVKKFQGVIGAYVDGDWGPGTTKALQRFLNAQGV
jgi:hypothetical protein